MLRLFVGIELPDTVKQALAKLCEAHPAARWHGPEQLHLTLNFIGQVSEEQARRMAEVLVDVPGPQFELKVQGVGYFGAPERPQVLWAGVAETPLLYQLQQRLEARLLPLGLEPDGRSYTPHITLARIRHGMRSCHCPPSRSTTSACSSAVAATRACATRCSSASGCSERVIQSRASARATP